MVKAEDYTGLIKEKERMSVDTANYYEKVW